MADTVTREDASAPPAPAKRQSGFVMPAMSREERSARLKAFLTEMMADESGYDQEVWPELKAALDRDRLSDRKLFDE